MLFTSTPFLILLLSTLTIYYIPLFKKAQVMILIVASLAFYAFGQPGLLLLLLLSALINILSSYYVVNGSFRFRKLFAATGVILNLGILFFFKYSPLFAKTFLNTHNDFGHYLLLIPLPIGISFYTFEGISLLIDVYSNKHSDVLSIGKSLKEHFVKTLFFISFFPHLISGPILKAYEFYPQIGPKSFNGIDWNRTFRNLVLGYFLKMVIADNLTNFTFWMDYPYFKSQSSISLILMIFGYSFQIFADFAGYTLIALGIARLFGYVLIDNFNFPYISSSFSEFWSRWHISLSTFLREYLYIPLGGNRKGKIRTYLNLMITMILGGLWHGAAWSFALWGLFHGLALVIERLLSIQDSEAHKTNLNKLLNGTIVFLFVSMAWVLFRLPLYFVLEYYRSIAGNIHLKSSPVLLLLIIVYSIPVIIYHIDYLFRSYSTSVRTARIFDTLTYGFLLFLIIVNSGPSGSFIYFQF